MEQNFAGPELGKGTRKTTSGVQLDMVERPGWLKLQRCEDEPCKGLCQHWETQWQEFLRGLDSAYKPRPWEDAKAFLASFEQVAEACQWPRDEWVAQLLPALSGEAQEAFESLETKDREDYGKVKAAILRREANHTEALRQHFRQFRSREVEDPRRIYGQLQELCRRWLRPERHSKEQILELLILEQFLAILPPELQSWIRASSPENCTQAAALAEDFLLSRQTEAKTKKWQAPVTLKETGVSLDAAEEILTQPKQRTIFWRVLQEDSKDTDGLAVKQRHPNKGRTVMSVGPHSASGIWRFAGVEPVAKMRMEQNSAGPELEPRDAVDIVQPEDMAEQPEWRICQERRAAPCWEDHWQDFLGGTYSPNVGLEKEPSPWGDAKAFLASFEQVAEACQWPRDEWVARLLPALSGEAQQAFESMEARDREDYGKVKGAILRQEANRMEALRQQFRQFRSREVEDPRRIFGQLQELCRRWLRPERHSKEQILELLILEQFLTILPPELQSWIRAGGAENCTQAAALADIFLLTQQAAKVEKRQGLFKEGWTQSRKVEEEPSGAQREIHKEARQSDQGEVTLPGRETKWQSDSSSRLPSENQEIGNAGQSEGIMDLKKTDTSLTMAGKAQKTMFWQVLLGDGEDVESSERLLVPRPDLSSIPGKKEAMFIQIPEETEGLPGRNSGDKKRGQIKKEGLPAEEAGPEETQETTLEATHWNILARYGFHKPIWESSWPEEKKPAGRENECSQHSESLSKISPIHRGRKKPYFSKYGRKYRYKPGIVLLRPGEKPFECPTFGESLQQTTRLDAHQRIQRSEKRYEISEYRKIEGLIRLPGNRVGERPYQCPDCGRRFGCRISLENHRGLHTEGRPYECSYCGKWFRHRTTLGKHQKLHTGETAHECLVCGKLFISNAALTTHQRIHTGEKPFHCPSCERSFTTKGELTRHERIHTGERPFRCLECGKGFMRREHLVTHQRTHARKTLSMS
ncbi:uncharacterized protein LOC143833909 [Paroedura picta]|uniref:uncharacterized protein LOC143833909 n=1 Tax=Paroedura picta TaxID=143630 RepID=UPI004056CE6F